MSSIWGVEGLPLRETPRKDVLGPTDWNGFFPAKDYQWGGDPYNGKFIRIYPELINTTEPGGECKRMTTIELSGSDSFIAPPHGVTFIFVQGKESACIVTRDLGKDEKIHELRMNFIGLTDVRFGKASIIGHPFGQPAEMRPYAVVSALLNLDDLNEEKGSKPSSHKESSISPLNEEAAINFLKQKLQDDGFKETIQTTISALQCLYQENVRADEIVVYTAHVDNTEKCLSRGEIEMHLASLSRIDIDNTEKFLSRGEIETDLVSSSRTHILGPMGLNGFFPVKDYMCDEVPHSGERTQIYPDTNYTPKPGGECKHATVIELSRSESIIEPHLGVTFIFVQGKESACIVSRVLGKFEKKYNLRMDFFCHADVRLGKAKIIGHAFEQTAEVYPYVVVSARLNSDDLNEEKGSKKESSSMPLYEEAAINFLKHKLQDDGFKEPIQAVQFLRFCFSTRRMSKPMRSRCILLMLITPRGIYQEGRLKCT